MPGNNDGNKATGNSSIAPEMKQINSSSSSGASIQNRNAARSSTPALPGATVELVRDVFKRAAENREVDGPAATTDRLSGDGRSQGGEALPEKGQEGVGENSAVLRTMTFWKNGFSVGDGELMRYDNPANNKLLEQINAGQAPPSLLNVKPGQPVEVMVYNRITMDYTRDIPVADAKK